MCRCADAQRPLNVCQTSRPVAKVYAATREPNSYSHHFHPGALWLTLTGHRDVSTQDLYTVQGTLRDCSPSSQPVQLPLDEQVMSGKAAAGLAGMPMPSAKQSPIMHD
eukprot:s3209_g7.t1